MLLFSKNTVKGKTSGQCSCYNWWGLRNQAVGGEAGRLLWETVSTESVFASSWLLIVGVAACVLSLRCYG